MNQITTLIPKNSTFRRFLLPLGLLLLAAGMQSPLHGQEPGVAEGNYSFVILPDTQYYYTDQGTGNFGKWIAQMNWIRDHVESHNIKYVLHLGDITDQADHSATHLEQWNSARQVAGGIMAKVPLALSVGNHDGLGYSRTSLFSNPEYFGAGSAYASQPTLIETKDPGQWDNSVHRVEVLGQSWLILAVEWGPRDSVVAWADDVLNRYPDDNVILIVHAYLFRDSSRFDWELLGAEEVDERQSGNPIGYAALTGDPEGVNDGQTLWNKLIRRHGNVKLVLNGHVGRSGHGRRVAIGDDRHFVHQHLVNFQFWTGDGNGRMRLMEVDPAGDSIKVTSFSPLSGEVLDGPDLDFTFSLSSKPLKTHYREALRELDPVAAFRLQGEDTSRPLISQFPTWEIAQAEGAASGDGSRFESGRRIAYRSSTTAAEAWTALLWFHSDAVDETLPVLRIGTEFDEILSISADTSAFLNLPLDASHSRSNFDEASNRLTVKMEPSQWHHLVLRYDEGNLMTMLDGEVLSTMEVPAAEVSRFTLGDFADDPAGLDAEWRIQEFSYHAKALPFSDIEWLWRSAFNQTTSGEVVLSDGSEPIPEIQVLEDTYPGFALRPEIGGEVLFGSAETSINRIQDVPGASRDLYRRHVRLPKTLEYSDGILLATPQVSDASSPAGAPSPVQWKVLNSLDELYFGSAYATTGMSVLNVPLPYPFDASLVKLNSTFFPFASDWKGGYIDRTGGYLYGQKDVTEQVLVTSPAAGTYRLTPPETWSGFTLLGQTAVKNTRMTVQPFENTWDVTIHEGDQPSPSGEIPFSFILLPQDADGVRSGWFDPDESTGEGTLWQMTDTGSYHFAAPMGSGSDGVLQITPGTLDGGEAPLMRLYSSESGIWELEFEINGEKVDAPFAWAWISSAKEPPEKTTPVDARVLEALVDSAYGDFGWYFTERLSWIYAGYDNWPWVWSPNHGWLYLFPTTPPSDGLWFYSWDDGTYLYVDRESPFWAYSTLDGWIPWNRENG